METKNKQETSQEKKPEKKPEKKLSKRTRRAIRKKGREFFAKNQPDLFLGSILGTEFAAAALRCTADNKRDTYYRIAFTFKAQMDAFEPQVFLGNLGARLTVDPERDAHPYLFNILLQKAGRLKSKRMATLIMAHLHMDLASGRIPIPEAIAKRFQQVKTFDATDYLVPITLEELQSVRDITADYSYKDHQALRSVLLTSRRVLAKKPKTKKTE